MKTYGMVFAAVCTVAFSNGFAENASDVLDAYAARSEQIKATIDREAELYKAKKHPFVHEVLRDYVATYREAIAANDNPTNAVRIANRKTAEKHSETKTYYSGTHVAPDGTSRPRAVRTIPWEDAARYLYETPADYGENYVNALAATKKLCAELKAKTADVSREFADLTGVEFVAAYRAGYDNVDKINTNADSATRNIDYILDGIEQDKALKPIVPVILAEFERLPPWQETPQNVTHRPQTPVPGRPATGGARPASTPAPTSYSRPGPANVNRSEPQRITIESLPEYSVAGTNDNVEAFNKSVGDMMLYIRQIYNAVDVKDNSGRSENFPNSSFGRGFTGTEFRPHFIRYREIVLHENIADEDRPKKLAEYHNDVLVSRYFAKVEATDFDATTKKLEQIKTLVAKFEDDMRALSENFTKSESVTSLDALEYVGASNRFATQFSYLADVVTNTKSILNMLVQDAEFDKEVNAFIAAHPIDNVQK